MNPELPPSKERNHVTFVRLISSPEEVVISGTGTVR
jgi:hypothetical protein